MPISLRLWLLAAVVIFVSPAVAWEEPDGFRGVTWGAPSSAVSAKIPEIKCYEPNQIGASSCSGVVTIGPVVASVHLLFTPTGFEAVWINFKPRDFAAMRQIFVDRYGKPAEERSEPVQTRTGAKYDNVILTWTGDKAVIRLERFASRITDSFASIETRARHDREIGKLRDRVKEGKKDL
jgi:hypothetical protein